MSYREKQRPWEEAEEEKLCKQKFKEGLGYQTIHIKWK
jgi:hypothetical protein